MDPFAPGRHHSRRSSSGQQDPRSTPGHPLYTPASNASGLPSSSAFRGGRSSSYGSSLGGLPRLPSPGDALRGPDRFEHSLDLPPLQTIPRSTSPILGRSSIRRGFSDLPSLGSLNSADSGRSLGGAHGRYGGSNTADALTDPFAMPAPRLGRSRSRSGSLATDADQPHQLGSLSFSRPSSGGMYSSSASDLPPLPNFSEFSSFAMSGQLGHSSPGGGLSSPPGDAYPSTPEEGDLGHSHASRNMRKFAKRATFSQAQLNIMEELWARTEYPSNEQIETCASATGLLPKQIRTWFGNTRQARLAGTRREARHAPIPGQPGTGTATRRARGETTSMYPSLGSGSGMSPLGFSSGCPPVPSSLSGLSLNPDGGLGPLPSIASYYGPSSAGPQRSGEQGFSFPPLDPLPGSLGGSGGLLPGFGPSSGSSLSGLPGAGQRARRRSTTSYPSMNFDHGLPPPSKRY